VLIVEEIFNKLGSEVENLGDGEVHDAADVEKCCFAKRCGGFDSNEDDFQEENGRQLVVLAFLVLNDVRLNCVGGGKAGVGGEIVARFALTLEFEGSWPRILKTIC
jgi:hypothetical protein